MSRILYRASRLRPSSGAVVRAILDSSFTPQPTQAMAQICTMNIEVVKDLKPEKLWEFFATLSEIPRPSKSEHRVLSWLEAFANQRSLKWRRDATGNMVILRPGSAGGEHAPIVVIQGKHDQVTEKSPGSCHDFLKDPIKLQRDGNWIKASGTTLGADNGIGAKSISLDLVHGRTMLNLDTEEWGEICIGCAGGGDTNIIFEASLEHNVAALDTFTPCLLKVEGLLGGHSRLCIHEDRGNAVKQAARAITAIFKAVPGARLVEMRGGDKRNAIPRDAFGLLMVPSGQVPAAEEAVKSLISDFMKEFGHLETSFRMCLSTFSTESFPAWATSASSTGCVIHLASSLQLLHLLLALPHGVIKKSHALKDLVETSNNVASVQPLPHHSATSCSEVSDNVSYSSYSIVCTTRSSLGSALEAVTKDVYKEVLGGGRDPHIVAVHAGLECGLLGEKFPGMGMVSYGPTIKGAHSPEERVDVTTVPPFYEVTLSILQKLASGSLIRDRGCLYYVPWIVIELLLLMGGGIAVWIYFSIQSKNNTSSGLTTLNVGAFNYTSLDPIIIGTAVAFLVILFMVAVLSFARSFIEAAHDATGQTGGGATAYLWCNGILGTIWFLVALWLVFVLLADAIWAFCLYLLKGSINHQQSVYVNATWVPSSGQPCPGQCFSLNYFSFISENFNNACVCDQVTLRAAYSSFSSAYINMIAVLVGAFVIYITGVALSMNLACQFSHTKRENELIHRATENSFVGVHF
ncbi:hypothetical protein CEUSTIGMA_g5739.t1 [Chlamydomonas eustigma]|uniref:Peptidase M20 dimerisation domain-containing protein n=1 Tax=Chlamydomonas eustigma TaxID=1157962 RepID=A0A250X5C8_9CHLO|nr:hypothetical protein CEUSTIGMA_g5739.t1 [Chlamydomonas eustigma]|eukprot:GAX78297.1 hypothetical protein CEUSTIGMA_g5739.t1 [Chlamydomonas eustigma]